MSHVFEKKCVSVTFFPGKRPFSNVFVGKKCLRVTNSGKSALSHVSKENTIQSRFYQKRSPLSHISVGKMSSESRFRRKTAFQSRFFRKSPLSHDFEEKSFESRF